MTDEVVDLIVAACGEAPRMDNGREALRVAREVRDGQIDLLISYTQAISAQLTVYRNAF